MHWVSLAALVFVTACSPGGGAKEPIPNQVSVPSVSPQGTAATAAGAPASATGSSPSPGSVQDQAPATGAAQSTRAAQAPVLSLRRAFYLVRRTEEAQEIARRLGPKFLMVSFSRTPEKIHVGVGESFPERVRFELHFSVNPADGTVTYMDPSGRDKAATIMETRRPPVVDEAETLLGKGEMGAAINLLAEAAANTPAADIWDLLSYAHFRNGQWQAAADAGRKALELDEFHPYALYNTGMAEVALKEYTSAVAHLQDAAEVQPHRTEPLLGLARAYQESGQYALAADAVAAARKVAPEDTGAAEKAVADMISRTAPSDLDTAAKFGVKDGPFTIYLYPGTGNGPAIVYITGPDGVFGLPVGTFKPGSETSFYMANLPDGNVGYFLSGEPVGPDGSGALAWRLFVRSADGQLRQYLFINEDQRAEDFVRARLLPSIKGDQLRATRNDPSSDQYVVVVSWQLLPNQWKATLIERKAEPRK